MTDALGWWALLALHRRTVRREPDFGRRPVQLGLRRNPWRILIACSLLNQTGIGQARGALAGILTRWPTAADLACADGAELAGWLRPLGLQNRRVRGVRELSAAFLTRRFSRPSDLPWVGRYGEDAVRIFCCGVTSPGSVDRVLDAFCRANPNYEPEEL